MSALARVTRAIGGSLVAAAVLGPADVAAQSTTQLWVNVTLNWVRSSHLTYEVDFEPKVLLSAPAGEPGWANLDVTPSVEFTANDWLDLTAELTAGRTKQTDDLDTTELTPRVGVRFHLFPRQKRVLLQEWLPKRRLVIRDLVRVESRNFFYSSDAPSESTVRFRNRLELLYPLNRPNLADDGALSLMTDWEWFIPVSDVEERFASRQRIRVGMAYRRNKAWRFTGLYIWTRSRDTTAESFTTFENIVNFQVKRVW